MIPAFAPGPSGPPEAYFKTDEPGGPALPGTNAVHAAKGSGRFTAIIHQWLNKHQSVDLLSFIG